MDPAHIFRQGPAGVLPQQNLAYVPQKSPSSRDELSDDDGSGQRVAHTLTACCRCRQVMVPAPPLCHARHAHSRLEKDKMRSHAASLPSLREIRVDLRVP